MASVPIFTRRRGHTADHPVELRFVDMLLIVIATLMFVAVILSVTSAFSTQEPGGGRPATAPQITTDSVPSAIVGEEYRLILSVRGGDGSYTWSVPDGALPQGLELDGGGVVHGVPARPQTAQAKVEVTDGAGRTAQRDLVFDARPAGRADSAVQAPRIATKVTLLDDAVAGRDYRHVFRPDQGDPPYTWRITGAPPRGLRFAPDGTLAGRPAEAGTAAFTVTMTGGGGGTARQEVKMIVKEGPDSLFWRLLGWLKTAITVIGYLLVAGMVLTWILGAPPTTGTAPIWERWAGR